MHPPRLNTGHPLQGVGKQVHTYAVSGSDIKGDSVDAPGFSEIGI
jgi:hypothetical protein